MKLSEALDSVVLDEVFSLSGWPKLAALSVEDKDVLEDAVDDFNMSEIADATRRVFVKPPQSERDPIVVSIETREDQDHRKLTAELLKLDVKRRYVDERRRVRWVFGGHHELGFFDVTKLFLGVFPRFLKKDSEFVVTDPAHIRALERHTGRLAFSAA